MTRQISGDLLERAVKLHGHLGPFLVLGLRAGLEAKEKLGGKPEACIIQTVNRKPYLCAVDGIKAIFGNTLLEIRDGPGLTFIFKGNNREIIVRVKQGLVEKYMPERFW
jgi:formylmethanofuran dehydrogenase subunit E